MYVPDQQQQQQQQQQYINTNMLPHNVLYKHRKTIK
jgi:hypothetical protein